MEALFRDILASPTITNPPVTQVISASLGGGDNGQAVTEVVSKEVSKKQADEPEAKETLHQNVVNWSNEIEMQHLLDSMVMMDGGDLSPSPFDSPVELGLEGGDGHFGLAMTWDVDNVF